MVVQTTINSAINTWETEVRDYELDVQGIVNNACYLNYFEHARHRYINQLGVDFIQWHQRGFDLVVVESNIKYKQPLTSRRCVFCYYRNISWQQNHFYL